MSATASRAPHRLRAAGRPATADALRQARADALVQLLAEHGDRELGNLYWLLDLERWARDDVTAAIDDLAAAGVVTVAAHDGSVWLELVATEAAA